MEWVIAGAFLVATMIFGVGMVVENAERGLATAVAIVLFLGTVLFSLAFPGLLEPLVDFLVQLPGADEKFLRALLLGWGVITLLPLAVWLVGLLITRAVLRYALKEATEDEVYNWAVFWPLTPILGGRLLGKGLVAFLGEVKKRLTLANVTLTLLALLIVALFLARAFDLVK